MEVSLKLDLLCEISQSEDNSNIRVCYEVRSWPSHTQVRYPPIATNTKGVLHPGCFFGIYLKVE